MVNLPNIGIGIGAGIATALLVLGSIAGNPFAVILTLFAALPIAIVSLGWGWPVGLVASLTTSTILFIVLQDGQTAVLGLVSLTLPMVLFAYLLTLSRASGSGAPEWYPLGRLLSRIALVAAAIIVLSALLLPIDVAEEQAMWATMLNELYPAVSEADRVARTPDIQRWAETFAAARPFMSAALQVLLFVVNLWVAAKVTRLSGLLRRPSVPLYSVALPRWMAIAFGAAFLASLLPGPVGLVGGIVSGAVSFAFALVGLAVIHDVTAGRPGRFAFLIAGYLVLALLFFPIVLLGLVDTLTAVRARFKQPPTRNNRSTP